MRGPTPARRRLRLVRRGGRRLLPVVCCDVDGTINDEKVPERGRLGTVGPARHALAPLADLGIPVVLVTMRSLAEARRYAAAVGGCQVCIGEDGAAIGLPAGDLWVVSPGRVGGPQRVGDSPTLMAIRTLLDEVRAGGSPDLWASCDRPARPPQACDLGLTELLAVNRGRVASAVVRCSPEARHIVELRAPRHGLRTSGEVLHVLPSGVDKATGLRALDAHVGSLFGAVVDGVLPAAFGNAANDLPMLAAAREMGGVGALVEGPRDLALRVFGLVLELLEDDR